MVQRRLVLFIRMIYLLIIELTPGKYLSHVYSDENMKTLR